MLQDLVQQVEETAKSVVNDIHTALPGRIDSYDPETNLAVIQPIGRFMTPDNESLSYPKLIDVPLSFPYSQKDDVGVSFPIHDGDFCLIIISEVELDQWRENEKTDASLKFDLTSAMAIPGLILGGTKNTKKACSENAVIINSGKIEIAVKRDKVNVIGDVTINGDLIVTGTGTIGGIVMNTHVHGGIYPGSASTSGPK